MATLAPRIDQIRLPELTDADSLRAHESFEAKRIAGVDLSDHDLTGISLSQCRLENVTASHTKLGTADLSDVVITGLNAPVFLGARARLRDVSIDASRIGSAELYDTSLNSVQITGSKLGFINLRAARLSDVLFVDCTIDELDLTDAKLSRVAFIGTTINNLLLRQSTLANVDLRETEFRRIDDFTFLRGATLTSWQVSDLAATIAAQVGISVEG